MTENRRSTLWDTIRSLDSCRQSENAGQLNTSSNAEPTPGDILSGENTAWHRWFNRKNQLDQRRIQQRTYKIQSEEEEKQKMEELKRVRHEQGELWRQIWLRQKSEQKRLQLEKDKADQLEREKLEQDKVIIKEQAARKYSEWLESKRKLEIEKKKQQQTIRQSKPAWNRPAHTASPSASTVSSAALSTSSKLTRRTKAKSGSAIANPPAAEKAMTGSAPNVTSKSLACDPKPTERVQAEPDLCGDTTKPTSPPHSLNSRCRPAKNRLKPNVDSLPRGSQLDADYKSNNMSSATSETSCSTGYPCSRASTRSRTVSPTKREGSIKSITTRLSAVQTLHKSKASDSRSPSPPRSKSSSASSQIQLDPNMVPMGCPILLSIIVDPNQREPPVLEVLNSVQGKADHMLARALMHNARKLQKPAKLANPKRI